MEGTADDKIKKSLKYSILDGAFYSAMVGFGESFFSAFAIFLKATNLQIGLLGSLPQALGSMSQLLSNRLIKLIKSRKKLVSISALLQALIYIAIALVFFFGSFRVFHLILFVCLYWIFGFIASPAWSSWMGDLVNEKERGAYFGKRNRIAGFVSFFSLLVAGYLLQQFGNGTTTQYIGFVVIFSIALLLRIISFFFLTREYEPEYKIVEEAYFSFFDFIKKARFNNYGLFIIYLCFMNFAVFLAGPFFVAYMLNDLKLSYLMFTLINSASLIIKFLAMPVWGRAADRYGTIKVLSLTSYLMPVVPLLWLFSTNLWYLIIIQVYAGLVWAGFEITSFNFIFDTTTPQKRALCVSYYNVLNGVSILVGALLGSLIVKYNNVFWSKYLFVFLMSFVLRYAAAIYFVPKLKEVRRVESISYQELLLHIMSIAPTMGLIHKLMTFEDHIKNRFKKKR